MDVEFVRDSYTPSFLESYGWYILIGTIVLIFYYEKFIKSLILNLKSRYDDGVYAAKYHKNPGLVEPRLRAQEQRIQQLQEKYNRDADQYKEKQEEWGEMDQV